MRRAVLVGIGGLGFVGTVAQLALFRELPACFGGNELTLGILLGCWLVLTGIGTWAATLPRSLSLRPVWIATAAPAAAMIGTVQIIVWRAYLEPNQQGLAFNPVTVASASVLTLAPLCLLTGAWLGLAARMLPARGTASGTAATYAADCAGSVAGALVFSLLLAPTVDHLAALGIAATVALGVAAGVAALCRLRAAATLALLASAASLALSLTVPLDAWATQHGRRHPVVLRRSTPYGRLVVTRNAGQLTFFDNGVPVTHTANAAAREEIVHLALAQRPAARSVLLISGAIAGSAREVLKYPAVESVTCVEIDPVLIEAGRELMPDSFADPRIHVVSDDGRRFVLHTTDRFDAILIAPPDPTNFQLNRFYTAEFFAAARRALNPGGVLAFGTGRYENYAGAELRAMLASARATLATAFPHVVQLPASRVFFLGSDAPLTPAVGRALERARIPVEALTASYLDATLAPDRLDAVERASRGTRAVNHDFHPVLVSLRLRHWLSEFGFPSRTAAAVLVLSAVILFAQQRAVPRLIFAAGFAASSLQIVLLLALQAFYGALYQMLGLATGVFMLGLALGAASVRRKAEPVTVDTVRHFGVALGAAALLLTGLAALLRACGGNPGLWGGAGILLALSFAIAALVGAQFAAAARWADVAGKGPRLFSADLVGAAAGALIVSTLLLPAAGLAVTCATTAGLNLVAAALPSAWHRAA